MARPGAAARADQLLRTWLGHRARPSRAAPDARVGVVGLGAGTLACYRRLGQDWTFFEIDPAVLRYSRDGTFTFLADCAPRARIVIGDARLRLADEPPGHLDLLAVDAFSSDAIPMHLLTAEAFTTYGRALAPDGLLLVHISNRYVDLAPVVAAQARAGGWYGLARHDERRLAKGLTPSLWIALSRDTDRLAEMQAASRRALAPAAASGAAHLDRRERFDPAAFDPVVAARRASSANRGVPAPARGPVAAARGTSASLAR